MQRYSVLAVALVGAMAATAQAGDAARAPASVPHTVAATRAAVTLGRAEQAFSAYMAARAQTVSNVWIFPTGEPNTVFVKYDAASGQPQLVMLELHGDQVAHVSSFSTREQS